MNYGELNPGKSRIIVISFIGDKYTLPYNFPSTCKQCADAPCMKVCPVNAISREKDKMKAVVIDYGVCIHCKKCVEECPFGAMMFDSATKSPYKCELCKGDPACVSICPNGAIVFMNQKTFYAKRQASAMQAYSFLSRRNIKLSGKIAE